VGKITTVWFLRDTNGDVFYGPQCRTALIDNPYPHESVTLQKGNGVHYNGHHNSVLNGCVLQI